jgi:outer membrane protein OmpA-like peptidoglycan-associated protein
LAALAKVMAVKEDARGSVITLSGSVLFRTNEATLMPGAQARLDQVAEALLASPGRNVLVEGFTDSQGSDQSNMDLSQRRADAVRSYLVQRGCDATRIQGHGIGEGRPVADNATAEGRANNRRVEIVLEHESKL